MSWEIDAKWPVGYAVRVERMIVSMKSTMNLTMESVNVTDIQFSDTTRIQDGVLYVNRDEVKKLIANEEFFDETRVAIAKPGEDTRIINVVDVFEPRCKVDGGENFPGFLGRLKTAGQGTTRRLKGMAVVLCDRHKHWIHSKSLIDMTGPGAELGRYGTMPLLIVDPTPKTDADDWDLGKALRQAAMRVAVYLARTADDSQVESREVYDISERNPNLPNIGYFYQLYSPQHDAKGVPDPIFYGLPVSATLPLTVNPTEVIDGAVTSGYTIRMMETYSIQNHPIITELLQRHGKDLNFAGVVLGVCSMEPVRRAVAAMMVGNIMRDVLKADGCIMTKVLGGAPNVDMGTVASECEERGVKTTLLLQILNTQATLDSEVLFNDKRIDAIVNTGIIFERKNLPVLGTLHGGTPETPVFNDSKRQKASEPLEMEMRFICGCLNQVGASNLAAVEY
jgi:glycine reductase